VKLPVGLLFQVEQDSNTLCEQMQMLHWMQNLLI